MKGKMHSFILKKLALSVVLASVVPLSAFSKNAGIQKIHTAEMTRKYDQLNRYIKAYNLYNIDGAGLQALVDQSGIYAEFQLELGAHNWQFNLERHEVRSEDYKLVVASEDGITEYPRSETFTFKGIVNGNPNNIVRVSIYNNQIKGMVVEDGVEYLIEPLSNFVQDSDQSTYVVFNSQNLSVRAGCATQHLTESESYVLEKQKISQSSACAETEIAVAADYSYVQRHGGATGAEERIVTVLNMVQPLYEVVEIEYVLNGTWLSDCSSCDPWTTSRDPYEFLGSFEAWGNNGGFGSIKYDVASVWTAQDIALGSNTGVIGVARNPAVCQSDRYNALENHSMNSLELDRVDQAHELGHNWSANHDSNNKTSLMSPFIGPNNTAFSQTSISSILNFKSGASCLSACTSAPSAGFSANTTSGCGSLTVKFTDQSSKAPTSWSWNFGDGNTSTEQHPTHTYASAGNYTVSLTVKNENGEATETKTSYISVGSGNPYPAVSGAAPDTSMGGGGFNTAPRGLYFDALKDIVIDKVTLYAQQSASVSISIANAAQTVVHSSTVSVNAGKNEVTLNALIAQGNGYIIQTASISLYRNNNGISFPYSVGNLANITKTNASTDPTGFYYYFYDWKVREAGCTSDPVGVKENPDNVISVFPNPGEGLFNIDLTFYNYDQMRVEVYDIAGNMIKNAAFGESQLNKIKLDIRDQPNGIYILQLKTPEKTFFSRIVKY